MRHHRFGLVHLLELEVVPPVAHDAPCPERDVECAWIACARDYEGLARLLPSHGIPLGANREEALLEELAVLCLQLAHDGLAAGLGDVLEEEAAAAARRRACRPARQREQ
eukprot:scaffold293245_cov35-Tisochrysis_lutea.AAC.5